MRLEKLTWPAVARLSPSVPVVIPIAACEQHGHHLPLFTDSLLLGEIVRRAEPVTADCALWLPLQWLGNSDHHLDFTGTLSAAPRVYLDVLGSLIDNMIRHGFRRIVLLNGHGGNIVPGRQAVFEARQRYRERTDLLLLEATYWQLGRGVPLPPVGLVQDQMGHACEWETSMMLTIAPDLVGKYQQLEPVSLAAGFEPASRGWTTRDRTENGHIGDPSAASLAKGEALLGYFTDDVIAFLERVISWDGRSRNA